MNIKKTLVLLAAFIPLVAIAEITIYSDGSISCTGEPTCTSEFDGNGNHTLCDGKSCITISSGYMIK